MAFKKGQTIVVSGKTGCEYTGRAKGWINYIDSEGHPRKARPANVKSFVSKKKKTGKKQAASSDGPTRRIGEDAQANLGHYVKGDLDKCTISGNRTLDIDDQVARELRAMEIGDVHDAVARHLKKAKLEEGTIADISARLTKQYKHLNLGMRRMCLGNRARKAIRVIAES